MTSDDETLVYLTPKMTAERIVISYDIRVDTPGLGAASLFIREKADGGASLVTARLSNGLMTAGGKSYALTAGNWVNIAHAIDKNEHLIDTYIEGNLFASDVSYSAECNSFDYVRFQTTKKTCGDMKIDNIKLYEGTKPRSVEGNALVHADIFTSEAKVMSALDGKLAVNPYTGYYFSDGKKKQMSSDAINLESESLLAEADFEDLFGVDVSYSSDTVSAGNAVFDMTASTLEVDGTVKAAEYSPVIQNGICYIPVRTYAENCTDYTVTDIAAGAMVLSKEAFGYNEVSTFSMPYEISRYLLNERYTAENLRTMYNQRWNGENVHPRILATEEDFDRIRSLCKTDSMMQKYYSATKSIADSYLETGLLEEPAEDKPVSILTTAREALSIIQNTAMVYQVTADETYAKRVVDELENICSWWSWAPTDHNLDNAEMLAAVAIGYDWCYDYIVSKRSDVKELIESGMLKNGILDLRHAYYDNPYRAWTRGDGNWTFVVNAGEIMGALALADVYPEICFDAVEKAYRCTENALTTFDMNGGWYENHGYWEYAMSYLIFMVGASKSALGTDNNILSIPGIENTWSYGLINDHLSTGANNVGDAVYGHASRSNLTAFAALYENPEIISAYRKYNNISGYGFKPTVDDMLWYRPELFEDEVYADFPLDMHYKGLTDLVCIHEDYDNREGMYVSFDGGKNNASHGHLDGGSFIYDVNGYRWAWHTGPTNYTYTCHSFDRYRMRAEAHNVLVINPDKTGASGVPDQDIYDAGGEALARARVLGLWSSDDEAYSILDMQDLYKNQTSSYLRGFYVADNRRSLTIRDEVTLTEDNSEIYWHMTTKANIDITSPTTATLTMGGKKVNLEFITNASEFEMTSVKAEPFEWSPHPTDGLMDDSEFGKIRIKFTASGNFNVTVKLSPAGEDVEAVSDIEIAKWIIS